MKDFCQKSKRILRYLQNFFKKLKSKIIEENTQPTSLDSELDSDEFAALWSEDALPSQDLAESDVGNELDSGESNLIINISEIIEENTQPIISISELVSDKINVLFREDALMNILLISINNSKHL